MFNPGLAKALKTGAHASDPENQHACVSRSRLQRRPALTARVCTSTGVHEHVRTRCLSDPFPVCQWAWPSRQILSSPDTPGG